MVLSACSWLKPFSNLVQSCSIMLLLLLKKKSLVQLLFDFIPQVLVGQPYCWQKFYSPQQHVNIFLEQSPRHPERISSFAGVSTLPTCDWWIQVATSLFDQLNVPVDIQSVNSITAKKRSVVFPQAYQIYIILYTVYIYIHIPNQMFTHAYLPIGSTQNHSVSQFLVIFVPVIPWYPAELLDVSIMFNPFPQNIDLPGLVI